MYCEIIKVNGKYIQKSSGFPQNHMENIMENLKDTFIRAAKFHNI